MCAQLWTRALCVGSQFRTFPHDNAPSSKFLSPISCCCIKGYIINMTGTNKIGCLLVNLPENQVNSGTVLKPFVPNEVTDSHLLERHPRHDFRHRSLGRDGARTDGNGQNNYFSRPPREKVVLFSMSTFPTSLDGRDRTETSSVSTSDASVD